jgi:hypothetical protein
VLDSAIAIASGEDIAVIESPVAMMRVAGGRFHTGNSVKRLTAGSDWLSG